MQETQVQSLNWEDPLGKGMVTYFIFLPEEFHGQMSLAGFSPWGSKESNITESLTFFFFFFYYFQLHIYLIFQSYLLQQTCEPFGVLQSK